MRKFRLYALRLVGCWVVLLGIGCGTGFGQHNWKWQNPKPTGNELQDVQMVDAQTGWAVGGIWGTILKTADGGNSWKEQNSGTNTGLYSVHFIDGQTGWVTGSDGTILKTTNGGHNWLPQVSGTIYNLYSVHFTDAQNGWVAGLPNGKLLKTINGGQTWEEVITGYGTTFRAVHFFDAQNGLAVGGPLSGMGQARIARTNDGGQTWHSPASGVYGDYYTSIHFVTNQIGWVLGGSKIKKTIDGGQNWINQTINDPFGGYFSAYFINPQTGWICGSKIWRTDNGGVTWEPQTPYLGNLLYTMYFTDAQKGIAVGQMGAIQKTTDGGQNWDMNYATAADLRSVHFPDIQNGWAVGTQGAIVKTVNSGQSWEPLNSGITTHLQGVHFADTQNGWVVGYEGKILHTDNGGQSWEAQNSTLTGGILNAVYFIDGQTGWAAGGQFSGVICKTTNGGQTWTPHTVPSAPLSLQFLNSQLGWAVGTNGLILKTIDGGETWQTQSSGVTNQLYSVYFTNAQSGWAAGSAGGLLHTTNGGLSWQSQVNFTLSDITSVRFVDEQIGWIGSGSNILKTVNGGVSWEMDESVINGGTGSADALHFTDAQHGWAVGRHGTILTTITNNYINPEASTTLIEGKLFKKISSDCSPSTIAVPGRLVKALPGPYYCMSRKDGQYKLRIPPADTAIPFILQPVGFSNPILNAFTVCPPAGQIGIVVDTFPDTLSAKNFGFDITSCHYLNVGVASSRRRRCMRNTTTVSYVNQGSVAALNSFVLIEFPNWVRPLSASISHIALNDSIWRFNLDTISSGESGSITIIDSVVCGHPEIRNLTQCTKATIFPVPDCPSPNWNGSEISVLGNCLNGFARFVIRNKTIFAMADSVDYLLYLDSIQVKTGKLKIDAGDSLQIWVETNGLTAHLTVNQVTNHPMEVFLTTTVAQCGSNLAPGVSENNFPKTKIPNCAFHCLPIRDSYDPNDKQAFPIGFTADHVVKPGTEMEYLVRFQNTGNDTAYTVYVIDSLDNNLNVESLEIGAVSHPYELTLQTTKQGRNFLRFQFDKIMLPDSNANELKSHGFLQYRISPKAGLAFGSQAKNEAEIYFDFNPPVYTNQTITTFDNIVFTDTTLNDHVFNEEPVTPSLSTTLLSTITLTSAISGGTISSDGGPDVSVRGVVWNTAQNPTIALTTKTTDGSGTGTFTSNIAGLQPSTIYYVRAYATNSIGTSYGEERQFTTLTPATAAAVSTGFVTGITTTTATITNEISNDGGAAVTSRGVVWNTAPDPTITLPTKTVDGADTGTFTSNLTGLQPNTTYYTRAYATNLVGTSYGDERQFTTLFSSVSGLEKQNVVSVFPNPFEQNLALRSESETPLTVIVCDVLGKKLQTQLFTGSTTLSVSHLPAGVYHLKFPELHKVMKVVKQ